VAAAIGVPLLPKNPATCEPINLKPSPGLNIQANIKETIAGTRKRYSLCRWLRWEDDQEVIGREQ
jgi:hypothetical protein